MNSEGQALLNLLFQARAVNRLGYISYGAQGESAEGEDGGDDHYPEHIGMLLGPRAIVGTTGVGGVGGFGSELRGESGIVLGEELGVVVVGGGEFGVAVVERQRAGGGSVEVQATFELLQARAGEPEWRVIAVVHDDFDSGFAACGECDFLVFGINFLSVAHHVDAIDLAGVEPGSPLVLNLDTALEVGLRGIDGEQDALDRAIGRSLKSQHGVFAALLLPGRVADVAPGGGMFFGDDGSCSGNLIGPHRTVESHAQVFEGGGRQAQHAVAAEIFL